MTAKSFKITAFCLFYFAIFSNCFAQFRDMYNSDLHLNGHVDSVILTSCISYTYAGQILTLDGSRQIMIYNKQGQLKQIYSYSYKALPNEGAPEPVRNIYNYDSSNNLIEINQYFDTNKSLAKYTYTIKRGLVVCKGYSRLDNSLLGEDTLKLDSSGKTIERDSYARGVGLFTKSYFKYDVNNRLIEENTYRKDGSLMFTHYCQYDEDGNIKKDSNPSGSRETLTYSYAQYDKIHNWLIQIESSGAYFVQINERRITYY